MKTYIKPTIKYTTLSDDAALMAGSVTINNTYSSSSHLGKEASFGEYERFEKPKSVWDEE